MKHRTPSGIFAMLLGLIFMGSLLAAPAHGAANTAPIANDDETLVHQQGVVNINVLRNDRDREDRVYVVRVNPGDNACGTFTHDSYYVTYDSSNCAPGVYRAEVVVNDRVNPDAGLRDRSILAVTVEQNRTVSVRASETESSQVLFTNNDADHPVRCRIERDGEVIEGRYIAPGATVDVWSPDNRMPYACRYNDGAPAGEGTVSVTQLRPGGWLVDRPRRDVITAACNNERSNVSGVCNITGPDGWSRRIVAPAGEIVRKDYANRQVGKEYVLRVELLNGSQVVKDRLVPSNNRTLNRIR